MTLEHEHQDGTDHPEREIVAQEIQERGQLCVVLTDENEQPVYAYTIGRTERGQPELLIEAEGDYGWDTETIAESLGSLSSQDLQPGQQVIFPAPRLLLEVAIPPEDGPYREIVVQADHYYGRPVDVLCLSLPAPGPLFGKAKKSGKTGRQVR